MIYFSVGQYVVRVKYKEWEDVRSFTSFNAGGTADNIRLFAPEYKFKYSGAFYMQLHIHFPESIMKGE